MTKKLSLGTVKNLLRCSISNVCWIRGLFQPENFQDKTWAGVCFKVLRAHVPENIENKTEEVRKDINDASTLVRWLEEGVFDALKYQYLRTLELSISKMDGSPIEKYSYNITYPNNDVIVECHEGSEEMNARRIQESKIPLQHQVRKSIRAMILLGG